VHVIVNYYLLTYSSLFLLLPKLPWYVWVQGKWIERYHHEILDQETR
jgi:hypothetical protein